MRRVLAIALLLAACKPPFERSAPFKPGVLAIHLASSTPVDGFRRATVGDSKEVLYLAPQAELTEAQLQKVLVEDGQFDDKVIVLEFNPEGTTRMAQLTQANVNQRLAFVVDGQVVMAPVIMSRVDGGTALLTLGYTQAEAERMVMRLSGS